MSKFDEAWERYKAGNRIIPPNEQDFRQGWNAALDAAHDVATNVVGCGEYSDCQNAIMAGLLALEVEVQT